jgi:hypothetical protein
MDDSVKFDFLVLLSIFTHRCVYLVFRYWRDRDIEERDELGNLKLYF